MDPGHSFLPRPIETTFFVAPEPAAVRVLLFDAERFAREVFGAALTGAAASEGRFKVVGAFGEVSPALRAAETLRPDLFVIEPRLPVKTNGVGGPELVRQFARAATAGGGRLLICSASETESLLVGCLRAGAHGYVTKNSGLEVLRGAMTAVAAGENFYDHGALRLLTTVTARSGTGALSSDADEPFGKPVTLTARERDVWRLVASGQSTKAVAAGLGIELKTVVGYRTSLMAKLRVHNLAALTLRAVAVGLVSPW